MKESNELLAEQSMADQERDMFQGFALAKAAREDAARLLVKTARAQADAEWLLDRAIRMSEALRRRRGDPPWREGGPVYRSNKFERPRKLLIKALGRLGSGQAGDRLSAAQKAEKLR